MTAKSIRQWFIDLFGSRLLSHVEIELLRLRTDFEERLHEKDIVIASLREEKAALTMKITVYENTILPHVSRVGAEVVAYQKPKAPQQPSFAGMPELKSSWQVEVEKNERSLAIEAAQEEKNKQIAAERA